MMVTPYQELSRLIRRVLNDLGFYNIIAVTDADTALEKLREHATYGLLIADWTVTPGGGMALLEQVRADKKLNPVPFIMMSGTASKETVLAAKVAGADDFIIKPFSIATLKRKLSAIRGAA